MKKIFKKLTLKITKKKKIKKNFIFLNLKKAFYSILRLNILKFSKKKILK